MPLFRVNSGTGPAEHLDVLASSVKKDIAERAQRHRPAAHREWPCPASTV